MTPIHWSDDQFILLVAEDRDDGKAKYQTNWKQTKYKIQ